MTDKPNPSVSDDTIPRLVLATGHSDDVLYAAFLPDGKTIASLGSDRAIILWDVSTGEMLRKHLFPGPHFWWRGLSLDGLHAIASPAWNRDAIIDTETGDEERVFEDHGGEIAVSHDGRLLAHEYGEDILIEDYSSGRIITRCGYDPALGIQQMVFSRDGRLLAVSRSLSHTPGCGTRVYDVETGDARTLGIDRELLPESIPDADCMIFEEIAISPNNAVLAGRSFDSGLHLWELKTGAHLWGIADRRVQTMAFSPDSRTMLIGHGDGTVSFYDVAQRAVTRTVSVSDQWVRTIAFSPCGKYLVTGGGDRALRLWDSHMNKCLRTMGGHDYGVNSVAFALDGRMLLSTNRDATVRSWDVATCRPTYTASAPKAQDLHYAVSPDGLVVAKGNTCDGRNCCSLSTYVELRLLETGTLLHTFHMSDRSGGPEEPISLAFSPDGRVLAIGHLGFCVSLWDVATGELIGRIDTKADSVGALAFSPDGKTLAVGTHYDEAVELFSTRTFRRKRMLLEHTGNVNAVAFSPNGRTLATGSSDGTIKLWDPRNGHLLSTLVILPSASGISQEWLAYTPEGYYTGSENVEDWIRWEVDGVLHPGALHAETFRRSRLP